MHRRFGSQKTRDPFYAARVEVWECFAIDNSCVCVLLSLADTSKLLFRFLILRPRFSFGNRNLAVLKYSSTGPLLIVRNSTRREGVPGSSNSSKKRAGGLWGVEPCIKDGGNLWPLVRNPASANISVSYWRPVLSVSKLCEVALSAHGNI